MKDVYMNEIRANLLTSAPNRLDTVVREYGGHIEY